MNNEFNIGRQGRTGRHRYKKNKNNQKINLIDNVEPSSSVEFNFTNEWINSSGTLVPPDFNDASSLKEQFNESSDVTKNIDLPQEPIPVDLSQEPIPVNLSQEPILDDSKLSKTEITNIKKTIGFCIIF